jgi:bifunctional non-homologous end joining protein LigD
MGRLDAYRAKRAAARTPEPFDAPAETGGRLFVVHLHDATRLHWDLRLEIAGALASWAVPKGPSPNPADKRMAVKVEDHPLPYGDFEGLIPEGEYGAGPTIVWDRGVWTPIGDPEEGIAAGKLLFDLHGYKLRGRWTLVKTKQAENSWLLIKERDAWVRDEGTEAYPAASVWSGLTVDEMREPRAVAEKVAGRLAELGAPRRKVDAESVEPMLAVSREEPFSRPGWIFEFKYDGYRVIAAREGGEGRLLSRAGNDLTPAFPEIAQAVRALPYDSLVMDGEIVVHDGRGIPSFERLQKRGGLVRRADVLRASVELPATLYVFDLLACEGRDARPLPLVDRKGVLRDIVPTVGPIRYSDHLDEDGKLVYDRSVAIGLEGVVGKKADAAYKGGRSPHWVKVRAMRSDDFVVVGWTEPKGTRSGFGALHLADYENGQLIYAGSVGSGFDDTALAALGKRLEERDRRRPPCKGETPRGARHHWVEPEIVVEVRYRERTEVGLLRHPVFLRIRNDKRPAECVRGEGGAHDEEALPEPVRIAEPRAAREVSFTNLDKVFWPEDGYTKGDLVEYYRAVAPWLLRYLRDRPLVLVRHPDGIHGKSFYQKNAPEWTAEWVRTVGLWSEDTQREIDYFVCDDVESLLYVINSGAIPLHVWSSRVATLGQPDWCVLDLDPKEAPFTDVVRVARALRDVCEEIDLPTFVKTSGSTGLHVLVPLGRQLSWELARALGELLARVVVRELPEIATIERVVGRRGGKVYVDYVQNGRGRLIVGPFSARPLPGAPVSTPLRWREVTQGLEPARFTIATVPRRMRSLGEDPMASVLDAAPDFQGALEKLAGRVDPASGTRRARSSRSSRGKA